MTTSLNLCLNCILPDCVETDPTCLFFKGSKNKPQRDYYYRNKVNPDFRAKRYEQKKVWRKTTAGRDSMRKTTAKCRKENPEKPKHIGRDYH